MGLLIFFSANDCCGNSPCKIPLSVLKRCTFPKLGNDSEMAERFGEYLKKEKICSMIYMEKGKETDLQKSTLL